MISVIDMPPADESIWWRGKRGFVVGFFPSNCVAVITDKIPNEIALAEPSKPVLRYIILQHHYLNRFWHM